MNLSEFNDLAQIVTDTLKLGNQAIEKYQSGELSHIARESISSGFLPIITQILTTSTTEVKGEITANDSKMAHFANLSYYDPFKRPAYYQSYRYLKEYSNEKIATYLETNPKGKKANLIISFRGTSKLNDYIRDYYIITGKVDMSQSFNESLRLYDIIAKAFPNHNRILVGHSLGGSICLWITQNRAWCRSFVFNPGFNAFLKQKISFKHRRDKVYLVKGDPISNSLLNLKERITHLVVLDAVSKNPITNHQLENFVKG